MSLSYLFFTPARLPLAPEMVTEEIVRHLADVAAVRATLSAHLPRLAWEEDPEDALARGTVLDGDATYELYVAPAPEHTPSESASESPELMVCLRSSGRVDSASFVQRICDATGWVAFDDRPYCFQPHRPPMSFGDA